MKCQNCNATHSCGCKKRAASDGKECCTTCVPKYEQQLLIDKSKQVLVNK